jgi:glycosyltransferase involved in cell wall biosynthesis
LLTKQNGGVARARNHAYKEISPSAEFVAFMDSDDVWEPHALEALMSALEGHPEAVGAHGLGEFIDEKDAPLHPGAFSDFGRKRYGFNGREVTPSDLDVPTNFSNLIIACCIVPPGSAYSEERLSTNRACLMNCWADRAERTTTGTFS